MKIKIKEMDKVANVSASLAVEGLKPSRTAILVNQKYIQGKISSKEAIDRIKSKYLNSLGK